MNTHTLNESAHVAAAGPSTNAQIDARRMAATPRGVGIGSVVLAVASLALIVFGLDGVISRVEGIVLLLAFVAVLGFMLARNGRESVAVRESIAAYASTRSVLWMNLLRFAVAAGADHLDLREQRSVGGLLLDQALQRFDRLTLVVARGLHALEMRFDGGAELHALFLIETGLRGELDDEVGLDLLLDAGAQGFTLLGRQLAEASAAGLALVLLVGMRTGVAGDGSDGGGDSEREDEGGGASLRGGGDGGGQIASQNHRATFKIAFKTPAGPAVRRLAAP